MKTCGQCVVKIWFQLPGVFLPLLSFQYDLVIDSGQRAFRAVRPLDGYFHDPLALLPWESLTSVISLFVARFTHWFSSETTQQSATPKLQFIYQIFDLTEKHSTHNKIAARIPKGHTAHVMKLRTPNISCGIPKTLVRGNLIVMRGRILHK